MHGACRTCGVTPENARFYAGVPQVCAECHKAREAAAAAAMREAAKRAALDVLIPDDASAAEGHGRAMASMEAAMCIAALPLPGGDALASALAKARREGIEAAIASIAALADAARREGAVIAPDGLDALVAHLRALLEGAR